MFIIQNVLNNKLQTSTSFSVVSLTENSSEIATTFWSSVDSYLGKQLELAAKNSSHMRQALEGEYPKLLRLHLDFHKKLQQLESDSANAPTFPNQSKCVKQFETAYLSRSLKLVLDSVREVFSDSGSSTNQSPPSQEKVDSLIKTISSELSISLVDETLSKPVSNNVAKAISLFCQKCEQIVVVGSTATQVIDVPTEGQIMNVSVANLVHYMNEQVTHMVNNLNLNKTVASSILFAVEESQKVVQQILKPLLDSVSQSIKDIILTMHNEDFDTQKECANSSLYMRELKEFTSRVVLTYLSPYHSQQLVATMCVDVAARCLELFIRHACLIRPLSDAGRKKLLADFKAVEEAVGSLCSRLSDVGSVYSCLRSVRPLIVAPASEVVACPVLGQVVPHSLALSLLFAMGPDELPSPHQSVGWSLVQYSDWLDKVRSERDRLEFLSGAMQKYEQAVTRAAHSRLHPVYPLIKRLLDSGVSYLSQLPS